MVLALAMDVGNVAATPAAIPRRERRVASRAGGGGGGGCTAACACDLDVAVWVMGSVDVWSIDAENGRWCAMRLIVDEGIIIQFYNFYLWWWC